RRWVELLEDYDCQILYHPRKANVVADTLNRKSSGSLAHISVQRQKLVGEFHELLDTGVWLEVTGQGVLLANISVRPSIIGDIKLLQDQDPEVLRLKGLIR